MANTLAWYWHRLRVMNGQEIGQRFLQKALHWRERQAWQVASLRQSIVGENTDYPFLPNKFVLAAVAGEQILAQANEIASGFFRLFGHEKVEVGTPPQWNREPLANYSLPPTDSSWKVPYKTLPNGADCRVFWEVNRWREILCLAEAGWLNQRPELSRLTVQWLADWQENNPMGKGINWTSPLESAIRLLHMVWIDRFLCETLSPKSWATTDLRRELVASHAWWTDRYQSFGSSANNHLLGELAALACACRRWPHLAKNGIPQEEIGQKLQAELLRQFATDGGNKEQALHYHFFAMLLGELGCAALAEIQPEVRQRLDQATAFFAEVAVAGEAWNYGDSDDATISPFFFTEEPVKAWLKWRRGEGEGSELACWLGKATPFPAAAATFAGWNYWAESGFLTRRNGETRFRVDASPLGFLPTAAHGHLDALHLSVWHDGKAVLIDPGTGGYYASTARRAHLTGWSAHNGPHHPAQLHAPQRKGPFLWRQAHAAPKVSFFEGKVRGELQFASCTVSRTVCLEERGWRVLDQCRGAGSSCRVHWQLAPLWKLQSKSKNGVVFQREDLLLSMQWTGVHEARLISPHEPAETLLGLCSPHYGQVERSWVIALQSQSEAVLETRFFWLS